jgi:shikimate 5-dehydrogenase
MLWDVANGVGRRAWAGGECANFYSSFLMSKFEGLNITMPNKISS